MYHNCIYENTWEYMAIHGNRYYYIAIYWNIKWQYIAIPDEIYVAVQFYPWFKFNL